MQQSSDLVDSRSVDRSSGTVALVNLTSAHTTSEGGPDLEAVSPLGMATCHVVEFKDSSIVARRYDDEEEVRLPGDRTSRYASVRRERPPSNQQRKRELLWE